MNYELTTPCGECPFLKEMAKRGFTWTRLNEFASGQFGCHKRCDTDNETGDFIANENTPHCAGALIFLEKQRQPNQMMRIARRLGMYDPSTLNMAAPVVSRPSDCCAR